MRIDINRNSICLSGLQIGISAILSHYSLMYDAIQVCLFGSWDSNRRSRFGKTTCRCHRCHCLTRPERAPASSSRSWRVPLHIRNSRLQNFQVVKHTIWCSLCCVVVKCMYIHVTNWWNRRKKIATALLKACEMLSILWGFEFLALRAYEEDLGARKLYTNAGYQVVSRDPPWTSNWIGRKCRVLMIKRTSFSK